MRRIFQILRRRTIGKGISQERNRASQPFRPRIQQNPQTSENHCGPRRQRSHIFAEHHGSPAVQEPRQEQLLRIIKIVVGLVSETPPNGTGTSIMAKIEAKEQYERALGRTETLVYDGIEEMPDRPPVHIITDRRNLMAIISYLCELSSELSVQEPRQEQLI